MNLKLRSVHVAILILAVIFGGTALSSLLGLWKTTTSKIPVTFKEGSFAGQYDPYDIRGSYSFGDISELFQLPLEDLGKAFGLDDSKPIDTFQCKELESLNAPQAAAGKDIGVDSVRYFVALYKGLPTGRNEPALLPLPAVDILLSKAKLNEEQLKTVNSNAIHLTESVTVSNNAVPSLDKESTEHMLKGSTTFKQLLDWDVKQEDIAKLLNENLPDLNSTIKDYASKKEIEFSILKDSLQKAVNAAQE
jgi:hypothetical protein